METKRFRDVRLFRSYKKSVSKDKLECYYLCEQQSNVIKRLISPFRHFLLNASQGKQINL